MINIIRRPWAAWPGLSSHLKYNMVGGVFSGTAVTCMPFLIRRLGEGTIILISQHHRVKSSTSTVRMSVNKTRASSGASSRLMFYPQAYSSGNTSV